ncbi:proteinase-activated receptor 1 [Ambystoma mexicanum]|uniref:proteinase-activated receptor 1 n=1 Tax=Ambystoma mexicanum TaxID=8296 RepID=UPI0037E8A34D
MAPRLLLSLCCGFTLLAPGFSAMRPNGTAWSNNTIIRTFYKTNKHEVYEPIPLGDLFDYDLESDSGSGREALPPLLRNTANLENGITEEAKGYLTSPWLTLFVPSVYTVVFCISLPLNVLAVLMFLFKMKVKKPAVIYMLNLASADVLFASVLPFKAVYHFSGNNWGFGPGLCRFITAAFYCNMYCSVLLMMSISIDRFLAVVYPMHSLSWRTRGRATLMCVLVWVLSAASTIPLLATEQTAKLPELGITTCHDVLDLADLKSFYLYYFSILCSLFFFLPLVITVVCYVGIIRCLSTNGIENSSKKTRALILALVVFCVFILCFGPTNVLMLLHYVHYSTGSSEVMYFAYILCVCISSVSCCIDPIVYYYASAQCQRHLCNLLCCRKTSETGSSSSGPLMMRNSKMDTCSTNVNNSIYKKLLA